MLSHDGYSNVVGDNLKPGDIAVFYTKERTKKFALGKLDVLCHYGEIIFVDSKKKQITLKKAAEKSKGNKIRTRLIGDTDRYRVEYYRPPKNKDIIKE